LGRRLSLPRGDGLSGTETAPTIDYGQSCLALAGPPLGSILMLSDRFRTAVEAGEVADSPELFSEDAVFRSPVVYRPYAGRDTVLKVLEAAERVLGLGGHFRYVH
jgi:hypothetical protein